MTDCGIGISVALVYYGKVREVMATADYDLLAELNPRPRARISRRLLSKRKAEKAMTNNALIQRRAKESLAMLMVGDAMVTLVDPERHCRLWMRGPQKWREFVNLFVKHPLLTRALALGELGLGVWLAEKQSPIRSGPSAPAAV